MEFEKEYRLVVDVTLVKLSQNKANRIASIPQRLLEAMKNKAKLGLQVCGTTKDKIETS